MLEQLPDPEPDRRRRTWPLKLGAVLERQHRAKVHDELVDHRAAPGIGPFGLWLEQLIAESTRAEGAGIMPLADEPNRSANIHRATTCFAYLRVEGTPRRRRRRHQGRGFHVQRSGSPTVDIGTQMITVGAGNGLLRRAAAIDPFDQLTASATRTRRRGAQRLRGDRRLESVVNSELSEALRTAERDHSS